MTTSEDLELPSDVPSDTDASLPSDVDSEKTQQGEVLTKNVGQHLRHARFSVNVLRKWANLRQRP